jgi:hypothetical protein
MDGLMRQAASDPATIVLPFFSISPLGRSSHLAIYLDVYIIP